MSQSLHSRNLRGALSNHFSIPAEHSDGSVSWEVAKQLLTCDDDTLATLVEEGLRTVGDSRVQRFDRRDVFNLALHCGTGSTPPERAFAYALRWMSSSTNELLQPRSWSFKLEVTPAEVGDGIHADNLGAFLPTPEVYGGRLRALEVEGGYKTNRATVVGPGPIIQISGTACIAGLFTSIRSQKLRDIYSNFLESRLRWIQLPAEIEGEVDLLVEHGVSNCVTASLYVERMCRQEGFDARTRRGWVLGMLDLVHAWVEVIDDDGDVKIIDPIFGLFSRMLPDPNPTLNDASLSTRTNRLLPTNAAAAQPIAFSKTDRGEQRAHLTASILPVN